MAEALALGASIVAVIQFAEIVIRACKYYIETVRDYPNDLRIIFVETTGLVATLGSLKFLNDNGALHNAIALKGSIEACEKTVEELSKLFPSEQEAKRNLRKKRKIVDSLAWPFRQDKARKILQHLAQHKSSITMGVSIESLRDIKEIRNDMAAVTHILSDSDRHKIRLWLQRHVNPSSNHNDAIRNYEPGTGDWVFRTPEWTEWISGPRRGLWINGIPGAGKTVLAGHLVEELNRICEQDQKSGRKVVCVYYYCWHGRNHDETQPFLAWLLSQLCHETKRVPPLVEELYQTSKDPTVIQLLHSIEWITNYFDKIFVVIDALDESSSREYIADTIKTLAVDSRFDELQVLATSRKHKEIERVMSAGSFQAISMSNSYVDVDIRHYTASKIRSHRRFSKWPPSLQTEVEDALSQNAKGMFRWVVCQLDILRRIPNMNGIRRAISELPQSLDETYHRIFSYIRNEERFIVRHCLRWISFHTLLWPDFSLEARLSVAILLDSYLLSNPGRLNSSSEDDKIVWDLDTLKEACGCLVTFTNDTILFAHYTVREFMESTRAIAGEAAFFSLSFNNHTDIVNSIFAHITKHEINPDTKVLGGFRTDIFTYCLFTGLRLLYTGASIQVKHGLLLGFLSAAHRYFQSESLVLPMTPELYRPYHNLNPDRIKWKSVPLNDLEVPIITLAWMERWDLLRELHYTIDLLQPVRSKVSVMIEEVAWFDTMHHRWHAEEIHFEGDLSELLALVPRRNRSQLEAIGLLQLLDPGLYNPTTLLRSYITLHDHSNECDQGHCVIKKLIEDGAEPNGGGSRVTPLQIAAARQDSTSTNVLLEGGANVDGIGKRDGPTIFEPFDYLYGKTPLNITRSDYYDAARGDEGHLLYNKRIQEVEQLLIRYGANDFNVAEDI